MKIKKLFSFIQKKIPPFLSRFFINTPYFYFQPFPKWSYSQKTTKERFFLGHPVDMSCPCPFKYQLSVNQHRKGRVLMASERSFWEGKKAIQQYLPYLSHHLQPNNIVTNTNRKLFIQSNQFCNFVSICECSILHSNNQHIADLFNITGSYFLRPEKKLDVA